MYYGFQFWVVSSTFMLEITYHVDNFIFFTRYILLNFYVHHNVENRIKSKCTTISFFNQNLWRDATTTGDTNTQSSPVNCAELVTAQIVLESFAAFWYTSDAHCDEIIKIIVTNMKDNIVFLIIFMTSSQCTSEVY